MPLGAPPTADSISPNPARGPNQTFSLQYSAHNGRGYSDLSEAFVNFNPAQLNAGGCEVKYYQSADDLYLLNDTATAWLGPLAAGSAGTLSNSQCTLLGSGSSYGVSGDNATLAIELTFSNAFTGLNNIYLYAADATLNSGLVEKGTWTP